VSTSSTLVDLFAGNCLLCLFVVTVGAINSEVYYKFMLQFVQRNLYGKKTKLAQVLNFKSNRAVLYVVVIGILCFFKSCMVHGLDL